MHSLPHTVHEWWVAHPGWVNFIYFMIAIWISLFTAKAREFVIMPFRATTAWMQLGARREAKNNLMAIKFIHNDPYRLVLHMAYGLVDAIVWSGAITLLYSLATIVIGLTMHDKTLFSMTPYSIFFGGIIGRAMVMRQTLGYLYNYDESVKMLETATVPPSQPQGN
jgi:hypothetical protein